ncbi:MAG: hypothetical protein L3J69_07845 [Desulfobacula sp.]|nr:hypothetical protein [Desulfobacula sp.]
MKKNIVVRTNDPDKKKFNLVVTGQVEQVVKIEPPSVNLYGKPGDKLESIITITPSPKYNFSILKMEHREGSGITARLIKPAGKDQPWQVKITCTARTVTNLYDYITLKTDSEFRPVLNIRISVMFIDQ